jgi:hypothetical protein
MSDLGAQRSDRLFVIFFLGLPVTNMADLVE